MGFLRLGGFSFGVGLELGVMAQEALRHPEFMGRGMMGSE